MTWPMLIKSASVPVGTGLVVSFLLVVIHSDQAVLFYSLSHGWELLVPQGKGCVALVSTMPSRSDGSGIALLDTAE